MAVKQPSFWNIAVIAEGASAAGFADALDPFGLSVTRFKETSDSDPGPVNWRITALADHEPDRAEIEAAIGQAADRAGAPVPEIHIEKLENVDWLALNRRQFPPLSAGGFFIHGSHFEGEAPKDKIAICLDAGPAFGSGTHESTQGCLMAITELCEPTKLTELGGFERVLDLGCGSGILTLALASVSGAKVLASDFEQVAVETVAFNAKANGLADQVEAVLCDGVGEVVRARAPFDLVVANILAEPLIEMAPDLGEVVRSGGILVLSGLLGVQQGDVMAAYEAAGFARLKCIGLGEWCTLITRYGPGG